MFQKMNETSKNFKHSNEKSVIDLFNNFIFVLVISLQQTKNSTVYSKYKYFLENIEITNYKKDHIANLFN